MRQKRIILAQKSRAQREKDEGKTSKKERKENEDGKQPSVYLS